MAPAARCQRKVMRRTHHDFSGKAVGTIPWRTGKVTHAGVRQAILPLREKAGDHMVAGPEFADAAAHLFHNAGAVRHHDAPCFSRDRAVCDQQIVIVK